ncbi:MAG: hypothetical protein K9H16_10845 [Bacteroidales bacterium]|nr:hypothetical protein [Bacteroidales bacterium]
MMKDIKQTTEQLKELAKVLNEFKSETVQLKILEFLFKDGIDFQAPAEIEVQEAKPSVAEPTSAPVDKTKPVAVEPAKPAVAKAVRTPKQKAAPAPKVSRKRSTTRPGPSVILKQLIENNFFTDNRTIGDVVDYCMKMYNYEYKSTDLSGTLAKLSKDGVLKRKKNPKSNQFEYNMS